MAPVYLDSKETRVKSTQPVEKMNMPTRKNRSNRNRKNRRNNTGAETSLNTGAATNSTVGAAPAATPAAAPAAAPTATVATVGGRRRKAHTRKHRKGRKGSRKH